ncbi:Hismacro and SEC14 domain-containing proteins [Plasmopara halstedii]|uniref:Hismacro and SEC14 domain-containing proteins n=1 Tax=Plasmopara halstedii TaxID=4781 RepID=A0A0P1AYK2_PLAHL|nr:Hismacro and SEC14 domain-containing proteins [Plasmopara halstedii]CEG46362.1 Hismacro and SEC14 domain-containing proteins [Plasmopara halstedii]|eukprot:XP_024582731.1 Hismacro and SEC14 domain-containing proteins [Plasmopara halstedii]
MTTPCDENLRHNYATTDAPMPKRLCKTNSRSCPQAIVCVFSVENLVRGLLLLLDLPTVCSLLEVLAANNSWRSVLSNNEVWNKMLSVYFGGDLPPTEQLNDDEEHEVTEEETEEQDDDDALDLDDDVEEDMEIENDEALSEEDEESEDENSDSDVTSHPTSRLENDTESIAQAPHVTTFKWISAMSIKLVQGASCTKLTEFLRSAEQLMHFDTRFQIVRGDIGKIQTIGKQKVDGLAFPTALSLLNPHSGAASVIFQRAGQRLRDHVSTLNVRLDVGKTHTTPGFAAGVDKLIHCVGPNAYSPHCMRDLQRTYRNVLRAVEREKLTCVAMASISTGNMGLPVEKAAWFALCAIQRYMRSTDWTATIGIVCFDADVYDAFTKFKAKVMTQFNAKKLRASPPLRNR